VPIRASGSGLSLFVASNATYYQEECTNGRSSRWRAAVEGDVTEKRCWLARWVAQRGSVDADCVAAVAETVE